MNKYLSAALAASLLALPSLTRADETTRTIPTRSATPIGVDMGRGLHKQGIDVNADVLLQGIKDGLGGRPAEDDG